ncbi:MAG: YhbY family RNA-binding protein [Clostridia bacterium]|nr:YhbY family RNA-binding protein [Clostridia bacterium]
MLNSKQRSTLKSVASKMDAIFQIGKGGIGDAAVKSIADALEARELVKISVLDNSDEDAREAGEEIASRTGSEVVAVIGRKIILYKQSSREDRRNISTLI